MKVVAIIILSCVLLLSGCSDKNIPGNQNGSKTENTDAENIQANPNPNKLSADTLASSPLDVGIETAYDNIIVSTENNIYPVNVGEIECTITNKNVGNGFYYYSIPYLEQYQDGNWKRLAYYPPELQYEELWYFCAIEGNKDKENSTVVFFDSQYVKQGLIEGKYRLVIFVGPNEYYAEFDLKS